MTPGLNPVPVMVTVKLPVGIGLGDAEMRMGPAGSRFTYTAPRVFLSEASASMRMLAEGILAGAL